MSVTVDAGALQRLDQRIGQPLRQLVQRHQPVGGVARRHRRMPPAVAERDAAERQPRSARSARAACSSSLRIAGAGSLAAVGQRRKVIEQAARARRVVLREDVRLRGNQRAQPRATASARPSRPTSGLSRRT